MKPSDLRIKRLFARYFEIRGITDEAEKRRVMAEILVKIKAIKDERKT